MKAEKLKRQIRIETLKQSAPDWEFRGGNLKLFAFTPWIADGRVFNEVLVSGPAETGKTIAALAFMDKLARTHKRARGAIVRKVRSDMDSTVLDIYKQEFIERRGGIQSGIQTIGGENVRFYRYENGTRIWVAGIDRPGKVLSGALDFVYVNQAEEVTLADWETLSTRTTGRAGRIVPVGILFGDCNPADPNHWILARESEGALLRFESRHEDNPRLFQVDGTVTLHGQITLGKLDNLTGVRKERLRWGKWVRAEGVVYENYDPAIHILDYNSSAFPHDSIPKEWRRIVSLDFGFTNPFACSWYALDGDKRMFRYRQIYRTGRLVEDHQRHILYYSMGEHIEAFIADHDAEDRATLALPRAFFCRTCNVPILTGAIELAHQKHEVLRGAIVTRPAVKEIKRGIQLVTSRLNVADDRRARLYFMRNSLVERDETLAAAHKPLCTEDEMLVYMWEKHADGKPNKEVPHDEDNHGLDETRYAVMYVDAPKGWARGMGG